MKLKIADLSNATAALVALLALALPQVAVADEETGTGGAVISGTGVDVSGNAGAFQKRHQVNANGFGGIENYTFEKTYGDGTFSVDGRAIFGNNDYNLVLRYIKGDKYKVEAGYREFRTWYDSTGTVLPQVDSNSGLAAVTRLYGIDGFEIDRSSFWLDGKFALTPNFDVHLRYVHNERNGQKDSTSQGDTNLGGLGTRSVTPSFYDIDEKQDLYQVEATIHNDMSELTAALIWDNRKVDNARNEVRRATEAGQTRNITQIETNDSDLFNVRAYARHEYNEKVALNAAFSHTKLDTVLGGSRITGSDFYSEWNPAYANRQYHDEGFFDLSGDSSTTLNVWNMNVTYTPIENWTIVPSFRAERESRNVESEFVETAINASKGADLADLEVLSDRHWDEWTASVESRYTGVKKWVFIGRALWTHGDGDLAENQIEEGDSLINRDSVINKWTEKYSLLANWYPTAKVNFSFSYSYWDRYTDYDTLGTSANSSVTSGDRYPAFIKSLNLNTNDFAARMTLRPATNVTLVSRVDVQKTDLDANQLGLHLIESGKYDTTILSQSINWNPKNNIFIQGMINYVEDSLHTPANDVGGAAANLVQEQMSDYWSANATVGVAIDEQDNLFFSGDYFFADNFVNNSTVSVPYGLDRKDYMVSATWTRRLGDRTTIALRYAYAKNKEDSAYGLNDYTANLVYGKLEYRF